MGKVCWSQWPSGLRRRSAAALPLRSWVRIPLGAWLFVCCECCVLSGSGLCNELITRPEESYRLWCIVVCDLKTSRMRRPWPALGCSTTEKKMGKVCIWKFRILWRAGYIMKMGKKKEYTAEHWYAKLLEKISLQNLGITKESTKKDSSCGSGFDGSG